MVSQFEEKEIVRDGVKGLGKVEQHEQSNHTLVDGQSDVICEFDECGLCAVAPAKACLEGI